MGWGVKGRVAGRRWVDLEGMSGRDEGGRSCV